MIHIRFFLPILFFPFLAWSAAIFPAQVVNDQPKVTSPRKGDVLQGLVLINGTTEVTGFREVEVAFGYQDNPTATWFMIEKTTEPVKKGLIASWDTSTITDGEYQLRVRVTLVDGRVAEAIVPGLRVRNYTPVETAVPDHGTAAQVEPTQTSLPDYQGSAVKPTPLPTNPAVLTARDLRTSALRGVAVIVAAVFLAGMYASIRSAMRHG
jgi:hypothetical protein